MSTVSANSIRVSTIGPVPSAVYRLYGGDGRLLYVGLSNTPSRRIAWHAASKEWGQLIHHATVTWHRSRRDGLAAEKAAVQAENPARNLVRFAPRQPWRPAKFPLDHEPSAVTAARERAGLTRTALAARLGCGLSVISQIESGARNATPAMLLRLAEALNCPVVVLERKRESAA